MPASNPEAMEVSRYKTPSEAWREDFAIRICVGIALFALFMWVSH